MSEKPQPTVAVVGLGHWGPNLMRNLHRIGCLAGICDRDGDILANAAAAVPNATAYDQYERVLADTAIEAIVISTPAVTHGSFVRAALDAGKHVFVEKPLCLDLEEGKILRNLASDKGLILMVGHLLHYHPAFQRLKKEVDAGKIGSLRYIYSNRLSLGKVRTEESALWSFAPHDIAMLLSLAKRMPVQVSANGGAWLSPNVADTTISHFTFSESLQARVFVSWLHPYKDHRLVVVGTEGMIAFHDSMTGEDKLKLYPHAVRIENSLPVVEKAQGVALTYDDTEPLYNECLHFIDCIANGMTPRSSADEGLRVLSVLDACQRSLASDLKTEPESIE